MRRKKRARISIGCIVDKMEDLNHTMVTVEILLVQVCLGAHKHGEVDRMLSHIPQRGERNNRWETWKGRPLAVWTNRPGSNPRFIKPSRGGSRGLWIKEVDDLFIRRAAHRGSYVVTS